MLHQILEANGDLPDRAKVVFSNTGREMPQTLDFVQEVSDRWSVPIVWVEYTRQKPLYKITDRAGASCDGKPFEAVITKKRQLPDAVKRYCTTELKVLPAKRFLRSLGWKGWTNTIGIRADEARRVKPSRNKMWANWHPLVHALVRKSDVHQFWGEQNFDLRLTTTSNCDGCFLKSEANRADMWRQHPNRMNWWVEQEKRIGGNFIYNQGYEELGDFVSRQGDWIFDTEGALCQRDGGECTG